MARKPKRPTFDVELVRAAARGRWPEILAHLGGIDQGILDGKAHPCPKCGGDDRFSMCDTEAGALLCRRCFSKRNGDGFSAIQWLMGVDFPQSLALVANYVNVPPDKNGHARRGRPSKADPAEHLKFLDWHEGLATTWCTLHKPGIVPAAMTMAHCRLARYRDQFTVFALPVWGSNLMAADPVGWCLYSVSGGTLPRFVKGESQPQQVKTKLTYGSQPGLIGPVERLGIALTVWKVEGPTDMLALLSLAGFPHDTAAVVTNANGSMQHPLPWMLEQFAQKAAYVLHDADEPGERGAAEWAQSIAATASECRHVRLPYEVGGDGPNDLRDWVQGG